MTGCFRDRLKRAWRGFLDLLFPPKTKCLLCGREIDDEYLCDSCKAAVVVNDGTRRCEKCSRPLVAEERFCPTCTMGEPPRFDRAVSAALYSGEMVKMIHRFKFGRQAEYAEYFGELLAKASADLPECDVIVPVPIRGDKIAERGYNQCDLLGKSLHSHTKVPVANVLARLSSARDQVGLSGKERRECVRGTVRVIDRATVKGKRVLVVDDVLTTGATLSECARVLKAAGCTAVYGLTVAITPTIVIEAKGEI